MMKKLVLLIYICCVSGLSYAQFLPNSTVERVTVGGVTYDVEKSRGSCIFTNINNYKENAPYVKMDGTPATGTWADYDAGELDKAAVKKIIREVFTPQELTAFKITDTHMTLFFVFNNFGKMLEASFRFDATDPVKALPLARIAQFEERLKAEVTTHITDPATKELQFIDGGYGYSFKRMDD